MGYHRSTIDTINFYEEGRTTVLFSLPEDFPLEKANEIADKYFLDVRMGWMKANDERILLSPPNPDQLYGLLMEAIRKRNRQRRIRYYETSQHKSRGLYDEATASSYKTYYTKGDRVW